MRITSTESTVGNRRLTSPARWIGLGLFAALALAGCGSSDGETIGSQTAPASTIGAATQDADAQDTTLQDTESVSAPEPGANDAETEAVTPVEYELDPLPTQDSAEAIAALVESIHGPTTDLATDINRLTRFPAVPTPAGAHLTSLWVSSFNIFGDDRTTHTVELELVSSEEPDALQALFESELATNGWTKTSTDYDPDRSIEAQHERRTFTRTAPNGEAETLKVTSQATTPPAFDLEYKITVIDEGLKSRFQSWFGAPIPEGAAWDGMRLATSAGPGVTTLTLGSEHAYENAADPSVDGIYSEVETLAAASPYPVLLADGHSVTLEVEGYNLFKVSALDGLVKAYGERTFPTVKIGTAPAAAPAEESDAPLADDPSAEDWAALLEEMHGPTADLSSRMRRLGPFPELPTPLGADIVGINAGVVTDADVTNVFGIVELAATGELAELETFYRAQLASLGWSLSRTEQITTDPAVERVLLSYTHPDIDRSAGPALTVNIFDNPINANVRVILDYNETSPAEEADLAQWNGWQGNVPIPDGGKLVGGSVSTRAWSGDVGSLTAIYNLPTLTREQALAAVDAASQNSDYTRNPELDRTGRGDLVFTHPNFEQVGATVRGIDEGLNVYFEVLVPVAR